ncbi:hypothetical protein GGR52DRAFT_58061 [Hypoxylon sp. FL1284]|nr:hypothetical protein GGR52DRAFT_58061 [Hypoxylon sp. FL1284]
MDCETVFLGDRRMHYCALRPFTKNKDHITCDAVRFMPFVHIMNTAWDERCIHHMPELQISDASAEANKLQLELFLGGSVMRTNSDDLPWKMVLEEGPEEYAVLQESGPEHRLALGQIVHAQGSKTDDAETLRPLRTQVQLSRAVVHSFLVLLMRNQQQPADRPWSQAVVLLSGAGALRRSLDALDLQVPVRTPDSFYPFLRVYGTIKRR